MIGQRRVATYAALDRIVTRQAVWCRIVGVPSEQAVPNFFRFHFVRVLICLGKVSVPSLTQMQRRAQVHVSCSVGCVVRLNGRRASICYVECSLSWKSVKFHRSWHKLFYWRDANSSRQQDHSKGSTGCTFVTLASDFSTVHIAACIVNLWGVPSSIVCYIQSQMN